MAIRGAIFDMDGTLVDSRLNFDEMRCEMGLAGGLPLLEAIAQANADDAERCWVPEGIHDPRVPAGCRPTPPAPHMFND